MSGNGDYIERSAAKEAAWENIINNVVEEQGMYGYLVHLVDKVFDAIPAADVRPVRRGKWKFISFMTVKCSNCQETFRELEGDSFCPNCGADMRPEPPKEE